MGTLEAFKAFWCSSNLAKAEMVFVLISALAGWIFAAAYLWQRFSKAAEMVTKCYRYLRNLVPDQIRCILYRPYVRLLEVTVPPHETSRTEERTEYECVVLFSVRDRDAAGYTRLNLSSVAIAATQGTCVRRRRVTLSPHPVQDYDFPLEPLARRQVVVCFKSHSVQGEWKTVVDTTRKLTLRASGGSVRIAGCSRALPLGCFCRSLGGRELSLSSLLCVPIDKLLWIWRRSNA